VAPETLPREGEERSAASGPRGALRPPTGSPKSDLKREHNSNLSGDDFYYKDYLVSLVKNMLCSQLHRQKGFDLIMLFIQNSFDLGRGTGRAEDAQGTPTQSHISRSI
jgi:hypothetical protein